MTDEDAGPLHYPPSPPHPRPCLCRALPAPNRALPERHPNRPTPVITLKNVTLRRSAKVLLEGASVTLNPGEKEIGRAHV